MARPRRTLSENRPLEETWGEIRFPIPSPTEEGVGGRSPRARGWGNRVAPPSPTEEGVGGRSPPRNNLLCDVVRRSRMRVERHNARRRPKQAKRGDRGRPGPPRSPQRFRTGPRSETRPDERPPAPGARPAPAGPRLYGERRRACCCSQSSRPRNSAQIRAMVTLAKTAALS